MTTIEKLIDAARVIDHAHRLRDEEAMILAMRRLSEIMAPFVHIEGDGAFRRAVLKEQSK